MRPLPRILALLLTGAFFSTAAVASDQGNSVSTESELYKEIKALDTALFDAFNRCADPVQLASFAHLLAADLEFYHDRDGSSGKSKMVANTKKNACGRYRRELIPNSLRVFPIGEQSAMEIGQHKFCSIADGSCPGQGEFLTLWKKTKAGWKATRMLSYDHKAAQ